MLSFSTGPVLLLLLFSALSPPADPPRPKAGLGPVTLQNVSCLDPQRSGASALKSQLYGPKKEKLDHEVLITSGMRKTGIV